MGNTASQPSDSSSLAAAPGGTWHWALNVTRPGLEACIKEVSATPFWRDVAQQYHRYGRMGGDMGAASQLAPFASCRMAAHCIQVYLTAPQGGALDLCVVRTCMFGDEAAAMPCRLPRLGIVITTESQGVRPSGLNHMEAYAFRQRYGFHSSIIE